MRTWIFGGVAALGLLAGGCASTQGAQSDLAGGQAQALRQGSSLSAAANLGEVATLSGPQGMAFRVGTPVPDSQDPIPIFPNPDPASSGGTTGRAGPLPSVGPVSALHR